MRPLRLTVTVRLPTNWWVATPTISIDAQRHPPWNAIAAVSARWVGREFGSIGRLAGPGSERYYIDKVAQGREDYYAGHGEAPGRWAGSALDLLMKTDGEVTGDAHCDRRAGRRETSP